MAAFWLCILTVSVYAQVNGTIVEKQEIKLPDSVITAVKRLYDEQTAAKIATLNYSKITYLSDGLKQNLSSIQTMAPASEM